MALRILIAASGMIAAASAAATNPQTDGMTAAPAGTANTRYCMRVEALTGSRVETVECWTRAEWADQGVDVDKEWAAEGVAVRG